jgi:hypothetical protein
MATLVTIEQAIAHLKLPVSGGSPADIDDRDDVQLKLDQAEAYVLNFYGQDTDWTAQTVPLWIQAAILRQFGELYRFRGDDDEKDAPKHENGYPSPGIRALINRDPPLA